MGIEKCINWIVSRSIHSSCLAVGNGGPLAPASELAACIVSIPASAIWHGTAKAEAGERMDGAQRPVPHGVAA